MDEETQEVVAEEAKPASFDDIEAEYDLSDVECIEVALSGGERLRFRNVDSVEWDRLQKRLASVLDICTIGKDGKTKGAHPAWDEWLLSGKPIPESGLRHCFWISELSLDPAMTFVRALRMYRRCGALIPSIGIQLLAQVGDAVAIREYQKMLAAKNA